MNKAYLKITSLAVLLGLPNANLLANDPFAEMDAAFEKNVSSEQKDEVSEFEKHKLQELNAFKDYKTKLLAELDEFKKISEFETREYQTKLSEVWDNP